MQSGGAAVGAAATRAVDGAAGAVGVVALVEKKRSEVVLELGPRRASEAETGRAGADEDVALPISDI